MYRIQTVWQLTLQIITYKIIIFKIMMSYYTQEPKGIGIAVQVKSDFTDYGNLESLKKRIDQMLQEIYEEEVTKSAIGWKQVVPLGTVDESTIEMVPIFDPKFKEYCIGLEKNLLLPFNFL